MATRTASQSITERAIAVLETRRITWSADLGGYLIGTCGDPDRCYLIADGRCCCPAFAKDGRECKHTIAVALLAEPTCRHCHAAAPLLKSGVCRPCGEAWAQELKEVA